MPQQTVPCCVPLDTHHPAPLLRTHSPQSENLTESLLAEGMVALHGKERPGEEDYDRLIAANEAAKSAKLGLHSPNASKKVRDIKWECNEEDRRRLMEEYRNTPVRAVVEYVRDACTVRAFLLPSYTNVMISLTGVKCKSRDDKDPVIAEGKYFTESRLLQREVSVVVEGWTGRQDSSTANLLGTVQHPRGNISEFLLKEGFARINDYSFKNIKTNREMLRAAEGFAKSQRKRVWANYTPKAAPTGDAKFTATVVEIINPERLIVKKEDGSKVEVSLASVRQPRKPRTDAPESRNRGGFVKKIEIDMHVYGAFLLWTTRRSGLMVSIPVAENLRITPCYYAVSMVRAGG